MRPKDTKTIVLWTLVPVGVVVMTIVVLYTVDGFRSQVQTPGQIHASVAQPAPSEFGWVRDLVQESEFNPPLSPLQQERLAEQCELILATYLRGDPGDYLAMIDSWGGWLRESYGEEIIHNRWTQAKHKFPWAVVERFGWKVGRPERMPETGAIDHTNEEFDGLMAVQSSLFDFGDNRKILNQDFSALIAFEGPVRSADGARTYVHMQFVWSQSLGRWLPSSLVYQAPKGESLPRIVF